jgi:hypothetical protein
MPPELIAHADWGSNPNKRWIAVADLRGDGIYWAGKSERVGETEDLLVRLRERAGQEGSILIGFDFPIGLPSYYAEIAGIRDFISWLPKLGSGEWDEFFDVAENPEQIRLERPFYPKRNFVSGADHSRLPVRQAHLLEGLKVDRIDQLRRQCERSHPSRRSACPLFWTVGAQQVGKAAINGWQEVLRPSLTDPALKLHIWPFSGRLVDLLAGENIVAVETYPAEFYHQLGITFRKAGKGEKSGKRSHIDRASNADRILASAAQLGLNLEHGLQAEIEDGFGTGNDGEDRFDAMVGLLGMLKVVRGLDNFQEPEEAWLRVIEGWIFGQELTTSSVETA